ncbi:carboxypeptidase-like regulatory domain-containing protein [Aestuariivivens sediminicola]|uniref:carboxypeptidase-like regulatory domain-containing protein n=1 Tax=Aestuariivivens sediminicola TaxID=2913560 RepID=UPI001F5670DF|nr:carboxypeptidase-like regulatory domain-containing protein [Aestuariivivens sediminicola]
MKTNSFFNSIYFLCLALLSISLVSAQSDASFKEIEGKVIDATSNSPLIFADVTVSNSNISTVTNSDGEFLLKIPLSQTGESIIISYLGYQDKTIAIKDFKSHSKIALSPTYTALNPINITSTNLSARELVLETLKKKKSYIDRNTLMTAFYRETIKKRRKNASLSEAVVKIHKQPYSSYRNDHIELIKARKNTDYTKLDTIALKLQGGPFSNLYTDIIKYPEYIFSEEYINDYDFNYGESTQINSNLIYVVNFEPKKYLSTPLYYGKLYIDANTLALTSAVFSLNVENKELSSRMYIRKKPRKVDVYPTEASYRVNYRISNGKWHYAYSNISLTFKVNWKGKLFNSVYTLSSEMAITDWEVKDSKLASVRPQLLRPTTILTDKASGFSDPRFWGEYNIIEPEKSIESAIKKIQRQLKRT